MEILKANLAGAVRREKRNGREYLVAPMTLIVPGVLNGSNGPLYYPPDETTRDVTAWNGMPIIVYHSYLNGQPASARDPDILEKQAVGHVYRASADGGKLKAEGWFEVEALRRIDSRVLEALEAGKPMELSTGLWTDNEPAGEGASHNGQAYSWIARNHRPDHLAILPDKVGACSIMDGCGVLVNAMKCPECGHELTDAQQMTGRCEYCGAKLPAMNDRSFLAWLKSAFGQWLGAEQNKQANSSSGDSKMATKLNDGQRKDLVDYLATNCDCWKGKEDRETLNKLSDEKLVALKAAAEKAQQAELVANAAQQGFEAGDQQHRWDAAAGKWESKPKAKPLDPPPAANQARLTAEEQEDLAFARQERTRQKQEIVERLVANVIEPDRPKHRERLMKRSLDELRADLAMQPSPPSGQRQDSRQPSYLGAAGVNPHALADNEQLDVLDIEVARQSYDPLLAKKKA